MPSLGTIIFIAVIVWWIISAVMNAKVSQKEQERLQELARRRREEARRQATGASPQRGERSERPATTTTRGDEPVVAQQTSRQAQVEELQRRRQAQLDELRQRRSAREHGPAQPGHPPEPARVYRPAKPQTPMHQEMRPLVQTRSGTGSGAAGASPSGRAVDKTTDAPRPPADAVRRRGDNSVKVPPKRIPTAKQRTDERAPATASKKTSRAPSKSQPVVVPPRRSSAGIGPTAGFSSIGAELRSLLRDPKQVRRAIITKELLDPPVTQRRDHLESGWF